MSFHVALEEYFCTDLIQYKAFDDAVKLVKDTYKLEVEARKDKKKFVITAVGIELLDLAVDLLKSWLERKKKQKGDSTDDRIKDTKENPLLDISNAHVIWIFWGELGSKLLSEEWKKEVERLRFREQASVIIKREPKKQTLWISCNFECFEAVKKKVENLEKLVQSGTSGHPDSDMSQKSDGNDTSQIHPDLDGFKDADNYDLDKTPKSDSIDTGQIEPVTSGSKGEIAALDNNGTSQWNLKPPSNVNLDKPETIVTNAENSKSDTLRQLEGASGIQKLSPHLGEKDESSEKDNRQLFCTPSGRIKVFVYEASIISLSGMNAIVNAANEDLKHIGGVAYHISKAAGGDKSALEIECCNYIKEKKKVAVGKNFTSSPGDLPYDGVIHAVGPMWSHYKAKDECAKDLCQTIINVLVEADNKRFSKIALPAISSGIFGVPKRLCSEMYIRGIIDYDCSYPKTQVKEIHFVDIKTDILLEIRKAYGRWKQNDKSLDFSNANSYRSQSGRNGSSGGYSQTTKPEDSLRQIPSASQYQRDSKDVPSFQLAKHIFVQVYQCSIVKVRDVDAIVCSVNRDFSINKRKVANLIREKAGDEYELEFQREASKLVSTSREDVLICKAGKLAETQKIKYVIHVKLGKIENLADIEKLRHFYIQTFESASKKKMLKIALPLIGAANLQDASDAFIQTCSRLFVKTLKEVVEARGKTLGVQEIHFIDLDEKIIHFVVKAFQEKDLSSHEMTDQKRGSVRESVSKRSPGELLKKSQAPQSGDGEIWLSTPKTTKSLKTGQISQADEKCSYHTCNRPGTRKKYPECGHVLCKVCFIPFYESECPFCNPALGKNEKMTKKIPEEGTSKGGRNTQSDETENCPICMDVLTKPECLPCGHKFHADCIKVSLEYKPACPICGIVMGQLIGNQPDGTMSVNVQDYSLDGYKGCNTIEICYDIPDGYQKDIHPHPGKPYRGTRRKAFLPNNSEGKIVLGLLKIAFKRKLIFTIGESRTTGKTDIVTWNDIHHKTRVDGGPTNFGYPDKTYLSRVQEELAAKGVTEKDIEDIPAEGETEKDASDCTIS
ncbi:hypothetical protein CHS0354_018802 [Potamilus streckersoni]|uniref:RING-type E3 ubiquitin transferase n=1 Tax=Potamilus streckersoni TaxID=2493646 RepID=A0AAE0TBE4_9BIVA|nr:hypothetical protein CHS0354_018802 [Potamilus streckersoni]